MHVCTSLWQTLKRRSRATISETAIYLVRAYLAGVAVLLPTPSKSCCGWGPVLTWLYCSKCRAWPKAAIINRPGCSTEQWARLTLWFAGLLMAPAPCPLSKICGRY